MKKMTLDGCWLSMSSRFFTRNPGLLGRLRRWLALCAGRTIRFISLKSGRSASALPGGVALMIYRDFLQDICEGREIVMVSGTNGKTTIVHTLSELMRAEGREVFANDSGANMQDGLASSLLARRREIKTAQNPLFIFEVDEAWFPRLTRFLKPQVCIVSNFFRDQLDRYGELDHTRELIREALEQCPEYTGFVLCADDPLCASLSEVGKTRSRFFGMDAQAMQPFQDDLLLESRRCPICGEDLTHSVTAYAHLGEYHCAHCGFTRPVPDFSFYPDAEEGAEGLALFHSAGEEGTKLRFGIPGLHNLYNAAAAVLGAVQLGVKQESWLKVLPQVRPVSGRMEKQKLKGRDLSVILIKNPVGAEQAISYIKSDKQIKALYLLLNDREQDGCDVSWIWDIDFEVLASGLLNQVRLIFLSGSRAADMALRLVYAGVDENKLRLMDTVDETLLTAVNSLEPDEKLAILPNYTAMLHLRERLLALGAQTESKGRAAQVKGAEHE